LSLVNKSQKNKSDDENEAKARIKKIHTRSATAHTVVIEVRINSNPSNVAVDNNDNNDSVKMSIDDNADDDADKNRGELVGLILINTRLDKTALANHEIRE
jgi:hypothetical protein